MFTDRMLLIALALGALLGFGIRQAAPEELTWWFVVACSVSMVFLLGAGMRWNRWRERNVLLASAGLVIALSISQSVWVFLVGGALFFLYFIVFYVADTKRFFAEYDRSTRARKERERDDEESEGS
jgi:phosphotransferase system  glucose/maltose/N-acetylglucosamine-specific IIC component